MDVYKIRNIFRYIIFGVMIVNMFTVIGFEKYIVPNVTRAYRAKKRKMLKRYKLPENPYLKDS